jgi:hypothetical protein
MKRKQLGVSLLLVGVMLILIVGAILGFLALFGTSHAGASLADTATRLSKAQQALEQYAATTGRLPCPADPTSASGDEVPPILGVCPTLAATPPRGAIPWRTIGLRGEDALDAWAWKISYRVFDGSTGLTQPGGASMVQCTTNPFPAAPPLLPSGLCDPTGSHSDAAHFADGKGLQVTDRYSATPIAIAGLAYVLISHGPSGFGTYSAAGVATTSPASGGDEATNTTATGSPGGFVARAASPPETPSGDVTHFDDVLVYRSITDLAAKAGLGARNWAGTTLNTANVLAALGLSAPPSTPDLGVQTLTIGNATITAQIAGVSENLSLGSVAGLDGIGGVAGGGGALLSSADAEVLHVNFNGPIPQQMLAVTLNGLGCRMTAGVCTDSDSVQFTFYKDGTPVGSPITKTGCNTLNVASFTIDLGASPAGDFNSVDISPKPTIPASGVTQFFLGGFVNCPEGSSACFTSTDTGPGPTGNHCS